MRINKVLIKVRTRYSRRGMNVIFKNDDEWNMLMVDYTSDLVLGADFDVWEVVGRF